MRKLYFDSEKYERNLSVAVLLPYLLLTIQTVSSSFIGLETAQMLSKAAVGFYFAFILVRYIKKLCLSMATNVFFFSFIFIVDSVIHMGKETDRLEIYIYFISTCLPIFVYVKKIKNWTIFLDCARKISYLIICLGLIFLAIRASSALNEYNMSLGYYLLFPTICMLYFCLNKSNVLVHTIFFIIGTTVILLIGSRGPILAIIIFWGLYELFVSKIRTVKELISKGVGVTILLICFFNFNTIVFTYLRLWKLLV